MNYDQVTKLLTPDFLQKCCELTNDFYYDPYSMGQHVLSYENLCGEWYCFFPSADGKGLSKRVFISFHAFLFQAFLGWNRKHENNNTFIIDIYIKRVIIFRDENETIINDFYYSDFELNKPLPPEIQALIAALDYCFQMEGKA